MITWRVTPYSHHVLEFGGPKPWPNFMWTSMWKLGTWAACSLPSSAHELNRGETQWLLTSHAGLLAVSRLGVGFTNQNSINWLNVLFFTFLYIYFYILYFHLSILGLWYYVSSCTRGLLIFLYYKIILKLSLRWPFVTFQSYYWISCAVYYISWLILQLEVFPLNLNTCFTHRPPLHTLATTSYFSESMSLFLLYVCLFALFFRFYMEIKLYSNSLSSFDLFQLEICSLESISAGWKL